MIFNVRLLGRSVDGCHQCLGVRIGRRRGSVHATSGSSISIRLPFAYQMQRMLRCLDLGTIASEDLCGEGGHSSGRLSEAS
jgi:hypothetical protein